VELEAALEHIMRALELAESEDALDLVLSAADPPTGGRHLQLIRGGLEEDLNPPNESADSGGGDFIDE